MLCLLDDGKGCYFVTCINAIGEDLKKKKKNSCTCSIGQQVEQKLGIVTLFYWCR